VFATAFYLVGLGFYALDALAQIGITVGVGPNAIVSVIAVLAGVAFTVLNVTGTENAAKFPERHRRAAALDAGRIPRVRPVGGVRVVAVDTPPGQAADVWEAVPILSVAALVFTSLPRVRTDRDGGRRDEGPRTESPARDGRLRGDRYGPYVLTIFVATNIFTRDTLLAAGETAMVEVGRALLGPAGALVIIVGGLLATMSSANASILSTSRAIYGVSKDALLPRRARVGSTCDTAHHT